MRKSPFYKTATIYSIEYIHGALGGYALFKFNTYFVLHLLVYLCFLNKILRNTIFAHPESIVGQVLTRQFNCWAKAQPTFVIQARDVDSSPQKSFLSSSLKFQCKDA